PVSRVLRNRARAEPHADGLGANRSRDTVGMQRSSHELLQRRSRRFVLAFLRVTYEHDVTHLEVGLTRTKVVGLLDLEVREDRHLVLERLVRLQRTGKAIEHLLPRDTQPEE